MKSSKTGHGISLLSSELTNHGNHPEIHYIANNGNCIDLRTISTIQDITKIVE